MDGCRECGVVGSHLFDCPDRIMELEKGILECQTRILALERELAEANRQRDEVAYRVEHPELAHLHYSNCPYKPWAEVPHDPDERPIPECTCGMAEKAAYWKGQHLMERGYHTLTEKDRDEAHAAIRAFDDVIALGLIAPSGTRLCACPPSNRAQADCWYCKIRSVRLEHAPVIRRAMGQ